NSGGITDLTPLSNLTSINGGLNIDINFTPLEDLAGLDNLQSIGGDFTIRSTPSELYFKSLHGLEGLMTIGGGFSMMDLFSIMDFSGLNNLSEIGGEMYLDMFCLDSFQGLENLTTIGGELRLFFGIVDSFNGLSSLTSIGGLDLMNVNDIDNFLGLDQLTSINGLISIHLSNINSFQGLEQLASIQGFDVFDATINNFIGLSGLQTIEGSLTFFNTRINSFAGLSGLQTIEGSLYLDYTPDLKNFEGLEQLQTIDESLNLSHLPIINFKGLNNLKSINQGILINGCSALNSFSGLEQLQEVNGSINIFDNSSLLSINALEQLDFSTSPNIAINNNPNLSLCESLPLCNYLSEGGNIFFLDNAPGCNSTEQVLAQCADNLSKIRYFTFYDLNQNEVLDPDEPLYFDARMTVDPKGFTAFDNHDNGGTIYLEPGDYSLHLQANDLWTLTTTSLAELTIESPNSCDSLYFGVFPEQNKALLLTAIQSPPTRCNESIRFEVSAKNLGTSTEDGTLWLSVDENITASQFLQPPDTMIAPNLYGWHFSALFPSQSITKQVHLSIPGPLDFPIGDLLTFRSYLELDNNPNAPTTTEFVYTPEVRCSYDPNDKLVHPNREGQYTLFDEYLIYTVRFQNTGNDVAYDVVITDTLDENLDVTTFQLLSSSHNNHLSTTLADGQFLSFEFNEIFLPDSTSDFEGSQGYVSYLIKSKEGLAEATLIRNTASIYFDANPPVVTNTTQNLMVSELPTTSVENPGIALQFHAFPNPTKQTVEVVQPQANTGVIRLINSRGQILFERPFNQRQKVSLDRQPPGVYWLQLQTELGRYSEKIIKL
ncbi:MAG: T9SS type A sorting domain-containing protein, partial [Bacteroidota bacterium]